MNLSINNKMKYTIGAIAAVGLMAAGMSSCKKEQAKELTPVELAKMELADAKAQCKQDSIDFVNSDPVAANDKLLKVVNLGRAYYGNPPFDNVNQIQIINYRFMPEDAMKILVRDDWYKNVDERISGKIKSAQNKVDIATGKVYEKAKQRVFVAEQNLKRQILQENLDTKKDSIMNLINNM